VVRTERFQPAFAIDGANVNRERQRRTQQGSKPVCRTQSIVEHQDRIIGTLDRFGNDAELRLPR